MVPACAVISSRGKSSQSACDLFRRLALELIKSHAIRRLRTGDTVPNLSANLASVEIDKDFMLSHGYIKADFDVQKWAEPEFLEQAAKELLDEKWKKVTGDKIPTASAGRVG